MKNKPLTKETKEFVAQAIIRAMVADATADPDYDPKGCAAKLCAVVSQCGIDAASLAIAFAIEGCSRGGPDPDILEEVEAALSQRLGDGYAVEFLQRLSGHNNYYNKVKGFV
ncbi:hypothetical protein CO731_04451 [Aminobacter sp. MSH1]|uniref:hypothetical protein n=1 Tax=Aminobacter sp. MSH1 TaxID=374606 RepID=UPI000D504CF8|nr:hypothetical protein [Aminobacter sp. MSH1]AWC24958.1 hypothetical protein CO731_04451 [Aminobacter sp. MSH1]